MATLQEIMTALPRADAAGDTEAVGRLSDAMRAHPTFQQNAKESLDRGDYKYAEDGFSELGKDDQRANMSKGIARSLGLRDSEVDVTQGMGTYGRFKLSFQPTEQDKVKHLEDTYGRENIRAVEVGGKMKLLYRDENETGNQFRAVDEEGLSLADFLGDTAGEVLPTAGAIAGGVAGFAGGGFIGSVAGAAAGGALARGAQDIATRVVSGEDIQGGEIAGRVAKEAAFSAGVDVLTLGAGRIFSKFGGKGLVDKATRGLAKSTDDLADAGFATTLSPAQRTSGEAGDKFVTAISDRTKSRGANLAATNRDTLGELESILSGGVSGREAFAATSERIAQKLNNLQAGTETLNKKGQSAIDDAIQSEFARLSAPRLNKHATGQGLRDTFIDPAVKNIEATSKANFEDFYVDAAAQNIRVNNSEITAAMKRGLAKFENLSSSQVNGIINQLTPASQKVIGGGKRGLPSLAKKAGKPPSTSIKGFKEYKDKINEIISSNKVAGFGTTEKVAIQVLKQLDELMGKELAKNPELAAKFAKANDFYTNELLATKRGAVGSATRQILADEALTNTQVVDKIISDPQFVREIMETARAGGADDVALKARLQDAFVANSGIETGVTGKRGITFNRGVADELFGQNGSDRLERLNKMLKASNVDFATLDREGVDKALNGLSEKARADARRTVIERATKESASREILDNKLLKDMAEGRWTDSEEFGKALLSANTGTIERAMNGIRKSAGKDATEAIEGLQQDFTTELFRRTKSGAQLSSEGIPLWNPNTMADLLSSKGSQIKKVLGNKTFSLLKDANKVMKANAVRSKGGADQLKARASFSGGLPHLFVVGDLFTNISERFWGWSQGSQSGLFNQLLTGVSKGDLDKRMARIVPTMIGTTRGAQALDRTSDQDPELRAKLSGLNAQ